ncbi:MAG: ATP-binding cassette domain-containing protein, partial [Acidobacteria bacterium]|nr:ATP-binding cassette domain-containing protein [Acidobacteriota bacterium]
MLISCTGMRFGIFDPGLATVKRERAAGLTIPARPGSNTGAIRPGGVSLSLQSAIEFRHVTHSFDAGVVLQDINFSVGFGEMAVILGGSGSGKSTILRLALGLIKPDEGEIHIEGQEITNLSEGELYGLRQKMGMVFQGGALFDSATVYENVGYKLIEAGWPDNKTEEEVRRQLAFIDFKGDLDDYPSDLSGGMRRVVAIARAMVGDPHILFFDEP